MINIQTGAKQLRSWPERNARVWYLLLQIGTPAKVYGEDGSHHISVVQSQLRSLRKIVIRQFEMFYGEAPGSSCGRYLFRFNRYMRDDAAATRLAEAFLYALSVVHGPMVPDHHDSLFARIPHDMVRGSSGITLNELINLERSRPPDDRAVDFPTTTFGTVTSTTPDRHEAAWRMVAVTFNNDTLFNATRFLKRSHDNFYVYPGQIREVVWDQDALPRTSTQQTHFEDALHNAFKSIEAVIGDPPKDNRKFFEKLTAIGIDPNEQVGYREKAAISTVIRAMNEARDKRSAHGSTPHRVIHPAELLEFQSCAEVILLAALEKARGSTLFP